MNARLLGLTCRTSLVNFNGTYILFPIMTIVTVAVVATGNRAELLLGIVLSNVSFFAIVTGATLAEVKTKPMSWCLPRLERVMGPTVSVSAGAVSLLYAALTLPHPLEGAGMPAIVQSATVFAWALGLYFSIVAAVVYTRDTYITSLVTAALFVLVAAGMSNDEVAVVWERVAVALVSRPEAALAFAAIATFAALRGLGDRAVSRRLCGAPILPLRAFDNPLNLDEVQRRIRAQSFNRADELGDRAMPGTALIYRVAERAAGSSIAHLVHELQFVGSLRDFLFKLAYHLTFVVIYTALLFREADALNLLLFIIGMTFAFFPPGFRPRLSPMLPVSRAAHFRALLLKAALVFVASIVMIRLLGWAVVLVPRAAPVPLVEFFATAGPLSLLFLALTVPVFCWLFTAVRSAGGILIGLIAYFLVAVSTGSGLHAAFLELSVPAAALATALVWMPFVLVAWRRCFVDDLLRL